MIAFGEADAFWYVVAGLALGIGSALAYSFRRFFRWSVSKAKAAFNEWFSEAVDEHVEPQFAAAEVRAQAAAAEVREQLRIHTDEEGEIVRAIVKEELAPVVQVLDERTPMFEHLEETIDRLDGQYAEVLARIEGA